MPQKFNSITYYTISEVVSLCNVNKKTLYRYIKQRSIAYTKFMGSILISEESMTKLKESQKPKIDIVITTKDIQQDIWLKEKSNLLKLKTWSQTQYNQWSEMNLSDLIAYWTYLIKPILIKEKGKLITYPTKTWLIEHGFKGFVTSFSKRYVETEGITTLSTFFNYIEEKEKK